MKREAYTTKFDKELRQKVNVTAAELGTTTNVILEVAYIYMMNNFDKAKVKEILENRK